MNKITVEYLEKLLDEEAYNEVIIRKLNEKASEPDPSSMKAYAIKDDKGVLISVTIGDTIDCIVNFGQTKSISWDWYESIGYRCVPVLITEIKTDK